MNPSSEELFGRKALGTGAVHTVAGLFRPVALPQAWLYDLVLVIGGSLLVAASAQIVIPLWPVPVTAQTFVVLLLGATLGARLGVCAVLVYLAEGAVGLPVFSFGRSGAGMLIGPTGGYLFGFLAAAAVVGALAQRGWDRRAHTTIVAMLLGNAVIYALGLWWLRCLTQMDGTELLAVGLYPFVVGDLCKAVLAAAVLPFGWRLLNKARRRGQPESGRELR